MSRQGVGTASVISVRVQRFCCLPAFQPDRKFGVCAVNKCAAHTSFSEVSQMIGDGQVRGKASVVPWQQQNLDDEHVAMHFKLPTLWYLRGFS